MYNIPVACPGGALGAEAPSPLPNSKKKKKLVKSAHFVTTLAT